MRLYSQTDFKGASATLQRGGILGVPTETVYGLAVRMDSEKGIKKLLELKDRPIDGEKALTMMLADVDQIKDYAAVERRHMNFARHYFPGELTIILPKREGFENYYFDRRDTIGIRIPAHEYMLQLIRENGPLLVTSANPRGETPCYSAQELRQRMPKIDGIVRGTCGGSLPSTVVDLCSNEPKSLRQGGLLIVRYA